MLIAAATRQAIVLGLGMSALISPRKLWCYCNTLAIFEPAPHCRADWLVACQRIPTNWGRLMTISSLLSRDQIPANAMEITDADFNRIEVIGNLIRHTEIVDNERRQHDAEVERLAQRSLSLKPR